MKQNDHSNEGSLSSFSSLKKTKVVQISSIINVSINIDKSKLNDNGGPIGMISATHVDQLVLNIFSNERSRISC